MSWLSTCTDDNKVPGESARYYVECSVTVGNITYTGRQEATRESWEYVGCTKEAADAQEAIEIAADDDVATRVYRANDAGEWRLAVTKVTLGDWE